MLSLQLEFEEFIVDLPKCQVRNYHTPCVIFAIYLTFSLFVRGVRGESKQTFKNLQCFPEILFRGKYLLVHKRNGIENKSIDLLRKTFQRY